MWRQRSLAPLLRCDSTSLSLRPLSFRGSWVVCYLITQTHRINFLTIHLNFTVINFLINFNLISWYNVEQINFSSLLNFCALFSCRPTLLLNSLVDLFPHSQTRSTLLSPSLSSGLRDHLVPKMQGCSKVNMNSDYIGLSVFNVAIFIK